MKKVFIVIAVLCMAANVDAQIRFGVKAGLNLSQVSSYSIKQYGQTISEADATDMLAGAHFGIYGNFSFSNYLGLQVEALYSMQGDSESQGYITVKEHFHYINIPVLLDIKPIPSLSIFAGPQVGFNVYNAISVGEETLSGSELDDFLAENYCKINTFDFAAVIGLQYTFIEHLSVGARYNIGFLSILGVDDTAKNLGISISGGANRVLQLSVGWIF
jgi:opacity protein-like surface antigen